MGGIWLYVKRSLRSDPVTLPECIVTEIQIDRKKFFFAIIQLSYCHREPKNDWQTLKKLSGIGAAQETAKDV